MEWLIIIAVLFSFILWCCCKVSSDCSKEEEYNKLDPKELDDDNKEWNIEEICTYDDTFVKKGKKWKKSNMK